MNAPAWEAAQGRALEERRREASREFDEARNRVMAAQEQLAAVHDAEPEPADPEDVRARRAISATNRGWGLGVCTK